MQRIAIVGAVVVALMVVMWSPDYSMADKQQTPSTLELRVIAIEHKLANLEQMVGIRLDDDDAFRRIEAERDEAMGAAKAASLMSTLMTVRSQLELYQVQHQGQYPSLAGGWDQLVGSTDARGRVFAQAQSGSGTFGPYLRDAAINPLNGSSLVVESIDKIGPSVGWLYTQRTGELMAVVSEAQLTGLQLDPTDAVSY